MRLHFGFEDRAYDYEARSATQVAEYLEARYGIVETFWEMKQDRIYDILADVQEKAIEDIAAGKKRKVVLRRPDALKIERIFKSAINNREFDGVVPGAPTAVALSGRSRYRGQRRGSSRASFVDSGTYRDSFRVWVE